MSRSFITRLIALSLITTLPLWAILTFKWPLSTDFLFYAASLKAFSAQFWNGDIYPRWLTDTNAGYGSPVFLFYSPLAFYVMSLFEFISPIDPHGFGRIFIGLTLSILVAGITSYRWLALETDLKTAEKGALIYAGFPYLLLHMYGGFAAPQLFGIALFPFLLEAAYGVTKQGWRAMPKLSLAYALLCVTHLPSILMFAAVPCLYVLVFSTYGKRISRTILAIASSLLGFALAAICLLPALLNKELIASEHFLDSNLVYANDFLDTYSQLGIACVILPLLVLYVELPKTARRSVLTKPFKFWLVIEAVFFFMALPFSKPIWDALLPLQYLQFPFRFFLVMLPGTVFIALQLLPHAKSRKLYQGLYVIGLLCAAIYSSEICFFAQQSPVKTILEDHLLVRPEYQTRWMEQSNIDFRTHVPEQFLERQPATVVDGEGSAVIVSQDSRNIVLHTNINSPEATVILRRFYFPGWQIITNNATVYEHNALLSLHLTNGSHDIKLSLTWFVGECEGMAISTAALMILLILYAFSRLQGHRDGNITTV